MTYLRKPNELRCLKPAAIRLVFGVMPEETADYSPLTFTFPFDERGEHLVGRLFIYHGGRFDPLGGTWVRIQIMHPRYELLLAEFWIRKNDGLIIINSEFANKFLYRGRRDVNAKDPVSFLDEVVVPAIESSLAAKQEICPSLDR